MVFGLIGVINLGHGAMLTLGAYFTWCATTSGVPFVPSRCSSPRLESGVIGLVLEHFVIRHFYDRPFETLLLTWGFFLIATEMIKIVFGTDFRGRSTNPLPPRSACGPVVLPAYRSVVALVSLCILVVACRTAIPDGLGHQDQGTGAEPRGCEPARPGHRAAPTSTVFVGGAFLAGLAGALISPMLSVDPYIGNIFLVRSFFVVTVGGIGQVLGGTLDRQLPRSAGRRRSSRWSPARSFAQTIVFALAIVVLRFRPAGLSGGDEARRRLTAAVDGRLRRRRAAAERAESGARCLHLCSRLAAGCSISGYPIYILPQYCCSACWRCRSASYGGPARHPELRPGRRFSRWAPMPWGSPCAVAAARSTAPISACSAASACGGGLAAIIGYFLFSAGVRDAYFVLVTLALSIMVEQVAVSQSQITGGWNGMFVDRACR